MCVCMYVYNYGTHVYMTTGIYGTEVGMATVKFDID